jgi:hypothetical protein
MDDEPTAGAADRPARDPLSSGVGDLRIGAYVLLADPAFLAQSIRSYYAVVDRIVVLYDEAGLSWSKRPLEIEPLLSVIDEIDVDHKVVRAPGDYHSADDQLLTIETAERNAGIAALGDGVDWILQIDSDEVLGNQRRFVESLLRADRAGMDALDYPARWLYGHVGGDRYLERCRRLWGITAGYPGPVAVRAGTTLTLARQCKVPTWHVDFRGRNTDPAHARDTRVDEQVRPEDAIWHFSWVRSEADMRAKSLTSGHAHEIDWHREIDRWLYRCRHPHLTTLLTPIRRSPDTVGAPTWLRSASVPVAVTGEGL